MNFDLETLIEVKKSAGVAIIMRKTLLQTLILISISCMARGNKIGLSVHRHKIFVYASSEGFGQSAHLVFCPWWEGNSNSIWASPCQNLFFWVSDQVIPKPACSATDTS